MFRRRHASASTDPLAEGARPSSVGPGLVAELEGAGWVLPQGINAGDGPRWTLVGTVASSTATPVDPAGLVVVDGWSLDWWIGGDDRWHIPAREAAVRQQVVGDAPVVETLVRIPGGDALHRAYGIRSPRQVGDEWVVSEVENRTAVPFALTLVIRPMVADGLGAVSKITIEPVGGGIGRDVAHLVRVDGRPAVVLPRRPARMAAGSRAEGDAVGPVTSGTAGTELVEATCPDGLATLALVFPLPHTARFRALIPVGETSEGPIDLPSVVPDADSVAAGWEVHRRGPRFELPERGLATALQRARTQLQLAHDGEAVRRDGRIAPTMEAGATEVILGAFDLLDRPQDVGTVVARWADRLVDPTPEVDALVLTTVSRHWLIHRVDAMLDWMLPHVAAAVERLDRAHRKGRLADPTDRTRAAEGLAQASRMFAAAGQADAARSVAELAGRMVDGSASTAPDDPSTPYADRLMSISRALASGDGSVLSSLWADVAAAVSTGALPGPGGGPGSGPRPIGHDLAASAALVHCARGLLVAERPDGLALVPVHPQGWYGGGIEVHDAPTEFGHISFAIRWHGMRPALLWDLDPHPGLGPVRLTAPALDPSWSTTDPRGDALLGEVSPPAGLTSLQVVAEHPDIDPVMKRPGSAPTAPEGPVPEGGSFS